MQCIVGLNWFVPMVMEEQPYHLQTILVRSKKKTYSLNMFLWWNLQTGWIRFQWRRLHPNLRSSSDFLSPPLKAEKNPLSFIFEAVQISSQNHFHTTQTGSIITAAEQRIMGVSRADTVFCVQPQRLSKTDLSAAMTVALLQISPSNYYPP